MTVDRDMGDCPASVNRIRTSLGLAEAPLCTRPLNPHFERAQQAMLRELQWLLVAREVSSCEARAIAGETHSAMLGLADTVGGLS